MQTRNAKNRVVTKLLWLETTVSFKDLHEAEKKKKFNIGSMRQTGRHGSAPAADSDSEPLKKKPR